MRGLQLSMSRRLRELRSVVIYFQPVTTLPSLLDDSLLPMIRRRPDAKALHLVKQRGAL